MARAATLSQCRPLYDSDINVLSRNLTLSQIHRSERSVRNQTGATRWDAMTRREQLDAIGIQLFLDYPLTGILADNGAKPHLQGIR